MSAAKLKLTRVERGRVVPGVIGTEALAGELSLDRGVVAGGAGGAVVAALGIVRVGPTNKESSVSRWGKHSDVILAVVLCGEYDKTKVY